MSENLLKTINRPLLIGSRTVGNRLVFAPMTFLGHVAFRHLLAQFGGYGLLFSEMCSAGRILHENRHSSAYFRWRDAELPHLVCQIVGKKSATMAAAARIIEKEGFFGVDLNFGCSAATICRHQWGAALLKTPDLAVEIVSAVRDAVSIPLFVKYRTGWQDDPRFAVELAVRFEEAGVDALTFHPRVAPDRRSRPPKWQHIALIKQAVSIPVIGNGNVFDADDCLQMFTTTGCDAVAIGRMAIARPWIFAQCADGFQPPADIYLHTALRLSELIEAHFLPLDALRRYKKFALYYCANFRYGHSLLSRIRNADTLEAIREILRDFFKGTADVNRRPNMNLLI